VIKQLKDNPDVKIKLTGHTDSVGRGAANRRLGRKRAEQVRDMLVKRGAPKKQIEVDSAGESEPVANNRTDAGRKKNRRVELEQIK
ncbi:MAG: OmpA family protein, partial [Thiolinea sp.]